MHPGGRLAGSPLGNQGRRLPGSGGTLEVVFAAGGSVQPLLPRPKTVVEVAGPRHSRPTGRWAPDGAGPTDPFPNHLTALRCGAGRVSRIQT